MNAQVVAMLIAACIFIPLLAAGIAHLGWAAGIPWPIRDRALLARTVSGRAGDARMPGRLVTLAAAIAILGSGVAALALADPVSGGLPLTLVGAALAALFLARGAVGYTAGWRARHPAEPFASYDVKLYSPLIAAIGVGFVVLVALRLI